MSNSRAPETLAELASETGARAAWASEAGHDADLVIVAIPEARVSELPARFLYGAAADVVVVDSCNYVPKRDGRIEEIEQGMTHSRWVGKQIGISLVKAFNAMPAQHLLELGTPPGTPGRLGLPVAGDDNAAKSVIMGLVDALGFDPVDDGGLDDSWRQQPGTPVYGKDLDADGVREALSEATLEKTAR